MPDLAAAAVSTATSVVVETPQGTIITTTLYTTATPTDEAAAAPSSSRGTVDTVPVGAIAGGAVAGVFLAVAAVIAWHLWGRSIKRKEAEKRKQAFAFFQVRENTRRNASTLSRPQGSYRPSSTVSTGSERKVKFVSLNPRTTFSDPNSSATTETEKEKDATDSTPSLPSRLLTHAPVRPSPLAKSVTPPDESPSPSTEVSAPLLPERPSPTRSNTDASKASGPPSSWRIPPTTLEPPKRLSHKSSNASSVSVYSDQSGEERQIRAPPSLIMAALSQPDPSQPLIPEYTPAQRLSATESEEPNRLSHASANSTSSREVGIAR